MPTDKNVLETRKRALTALANLGGRTTTEDDVVFQGKKFVVPETMKNLDEAIKFLREKRDEDEQDSRFHRTFRYRPLDGAVATANALKTAFGATVSKPIKTIFGNQPPQLIDVEIDAEGNTVQAPWGLMEIPGLPGLSIYLGTERDPEFGVCFHLMCEGPRKYRFHVEGLFKLVQHELQTNSIYRGKAIDGQQKPRFIDLTGVDPADVVYSKDVVTQLNGNVWSPIRDADVLAQLNEPGKRAVLFEGPYGTGKTLAAYLTAQVAVANEWTFLMVRPGRDDLMEVIQTARMYEPACVFYEDLDTVATATSGDGDHMSRILDIFDGLDAKGMRMLLVLTTNDVESLHPGMLRPGRLDAVISVGDLDREGVERLVTRVLGEALDKNVDWDLVHKAFEGFLPAFIREVAGRTKRYSVAEHGELRPIGTDDLVAAANGLRPQWEMQKNALADPPAPDPITERIVAAVKQATTGVIEATHVVDSDDGAALGQKLAVKTNSGG